MDFTNIPEYTNQEAEEIRQQLAAINVNGVPVFDTVTLTSYVHHTIECSNAVSVANIVLRRKREDAKEEE